MSRCRIVFWEGKSYHLTRLVMNDYGGKKYVLMTENGVMEECSDIGTVVSEEEGDEDVSEGHGVAEGEITAVLGCEEFQSCISCRGKVVNCSHGRMWEMWS